MQKVERVSSRDHRLRPITASWAFLPSTRHRYSRVGGPCDPLSPFPVTPPPLCAGGGGCWG